MTHSTSPLSPSPVHTAKPGRAAEEGRLPQSGRKSSSGEYIPTPEEIALAAAEIRSTWSEETHRQRRRMIPFSARLARLGKGVA